MPRKTIQPLPAIETTTRERFIPRPLLPSIAAEALPARPEIETPDRLLDMPEIMPAVSVSPGEVFPCDKESEKKSQTERVLEVSQDETSPISQLVVSSFEQVKIPEVVATHDHSEGEALPSPPGFDHFVEALLLTTAEDEGDMSAIDLTIVGETELSLPRDVTAISNEVAERLAGLEPAEKQAVAPVIQEITNTLRVVQVLRSEAAPAKQLIAAEGKLTELVAQLFEAIGVESDDEKVRQFVQNLLLPEFITRAVKLTPLELARMGTHEIKLQLHEFFAFLASLLTKLSTEHLLGKFALFRASPGLQANVWASSEAT